MAFLWSIHRPTVVFIDSSFVYSLHLHELALQRAHVEVEIPHLLVLKIGHVEKFLPGVSLIVETRL